MTAIAARPLTGFDTELLAALHAAIFTAPWDQTWTARSFADVLAMPGAKGWLLVSGEEPVGFALARFTLDEGEVLLTGIAPERRRAGYGAELLRIVIAAARDAGVTRLFLEHAASNGAAAGLYARAGFVETGRRKGYYRSVSSAMAHRAEDAITRAAKLD